MPEIRMVDFAGLLQLAPPQRARCVQELANRGPYEVYRDFYKPLRDQIRRVHREGLPFSAIADVAAQVTDTRKQVGYPACIHGYLDFVEPRQPVYFPPPGGVWTHDDLTVTVHPDLGLTWGGTPYVTKLHLPRTRLGPTAIHCMLHMMAAYAPGMATAVVRVRDSAVYVRQPGPVDLEAMFGSYADIVLQLWPVVALAGGG